MALAESNAPILSNHEICTTLVKVAQANALPVGFFTNLIWRESNFDHDAISRVGAMGIAQFMPDVADRMGLGDAFDARDALPASGKLLRTLRARFNNLGLVAAAYNAGPKRVDDWLEQRSELPKETRDYVNIITGRPAEQWRGVKAKAVVYNVPRHVPCHRSEEFSSVGAERTHRAGAAGRRGKAARGAGARGVAPSAGSATPEQEGQAGALHRGEPRPGELIRGRDDAVGISTARSNGGSWWSQGESNP